jgi:ABC-type branched-subunit amino acid transport system ATPase component
VSTAAFFAVEGLTRTFGGLRAVDTLQFTLAPGEIVGLLGPNGSGKTTVLNLISGALVADGGSVRLQGRELIGQPAFRIARLGVARTFQLVRVFGAMTARDNVLAGLAFGARPRGGRGAHDEAARLLARVGLDRAADRPANELTYIDQKRLELARALALAPVLLLLDEWLAGLNPSELAAGVELLRSLRCQDLAILLVEHVMDAIRALCDRCIVMNAGARIAEGTPAAVLADPAVIAAYLGTEEGADA